MLHAFLKRASYKGKPKYTIKSSGHISETDVGSIDVVTVDGLPGHYVLKTIDLHEQNFYACTVGLSKKNKTLRGTTMDHIKFLSPKARECQKWKYTYLHKDYSVAKVCYLTDTISRDGATSRILGNEYINEALIGSLVSHVPCPNFVKTYDAYIEDGTGHLLMDYAGHSLTRLLMDLSMQQFKSIVLQVLLALAIGQDTIFLKHHDVHLDNIFVSGLTHHTYKGTNLKDYAVWKYTIGDTAYYVRHAGVLARLGDFGLASATEPVSKTRFERVDYRELDTGDVEWGAWNGILYKSYDMATFLSKFFLDDELAYCQKEFATYAQDLYRVLQTLNREAGHPDILCSLIGRPLRDCEGHISPKDFLKHPMFTEFTVCPEDPVLEIK
jgi:serine/threonine protein kinase